MEGKVNVRLSIPRQKLDYFLVFFLFIVAINAGASPSYTFTLIKVIDPSTGLDWGTYATSINNKGQIAGTHYNDPTRHNPQGFIYDGGIYTLLDVPFGSPQRTFAHGINDKGQVVGSYLIIDSYGLTVKSVHGYIYDSVSRAYTAFDVPYATKSDNNWTELLGINNSGQLLGLYFDPTHKIGLEGFLYDPLWG